MDTELQNYMDVLAAVREVNEALTDQRYYAIRVGGRGLAEDVIMLKVLTDTLEELVEAMYDKVAIFNEMSEVECIVSYDWRTEAYTTL